MIGDGVRGQFARNTACTRNIFSPPPPTPLSVGLPHPPPPPRSPPAPVVSYVPPPPPNASLFFLPPSSAHPPTADKSWVWIVSVTVLVLGCGCCCVALVVTRRRRDNRDKDTIDGMVGVEMGSGLAPSITRAKGLGSANPNPIKPRSDGHMTQRRDTQPQVIAPMQANGYPTPSSPSARDGIGLGGRRVSTPIGTSTIAPNRYNMPSTNVDGTGLGLRRAPLPPIGEAQLSRTVAHSGRMREIEERDLRI